MPLQQMLYNMPPFLTAALLAGMGSTALGRGRRVPASRLLALLCLLGTLLHVDILVNFNAPSAGIALTTSRMAHLFSPFLLPLLIQFFHAYLGIRRRISLERFAYGYAVLVSACAAGGWIIDDVRRFKFGFYGQGGPLFFLLAAGAALVTLYNGVIIYQAILREKRSIQKNKLKYIFCGFGLLGALSSLNCLTVSGVAVYPPGAFGFVPLLIFAAGLFRYDLLDMGVLLRKGLICAVLTSLLIAAYLLLAIPIQKLFKMLGLLESPLFPLAILIPVALGYGLLKALPGQAVERFLSKERYDFRRTLRRVSQTIAMVLDEEKITHLLQDIIIDAMKVKGCALFLMDPAGGDYYAVASAGETAVSQGDNLSSDSHAVRWLRESERSLMRQQLLGASGPKHAGALLNEVEALAGEVVLPMRFKEELKGFLVLGEKRSGELYGPQDLDLLEPLCYQSGVAIQNAHAYQALQMLNRTLEMKIAERTEDLRSALAEKERSQEQLIRSESLAALGQLVAGVAHELNNPLTSVISLMQSTLEDLQQDGSQSVEDAVIEDLRFADKELARAKAIVASLLGLSRQTQTYEEAVDLNVVVRDTLRVLYNQYKYTTLNIIERLGDDLPSLKGNFANLGQVVLNIVKNAVQAAGTRGKIILTTRYHADVRQVAFSCEDNGPGIGPAERQNVFKPFFTTKPVGQGTGLGLYICHRIVEKHRGVIDLASAAPQGTIVTVRLPLGG